MSIKKPLTMVAGPVGQRCPVCGKTSYSAAGTHPQCAVAHADAKLRARFAKKKKSR